MSLRRGRGVAAALVASLAAACATPRPPAPPPLAPPTPEQPRPRPPEAPPQRIDLVALPGWSAEDHAAAFAAFRETCRPTGPLAAICASARAAGPLGRGAARVFLESAFQAQPVPGAGVLTGYYAPVYEARRAPDSEFSAAVRPKPADLQTIDAGLLDPLQAGHPLAAQQQPDGTLVPYPDRAAIEAVAADRPLAWMRPEELFFLQIQGSGVLVFEDGRRLKALYAANNGRAFVGVANAMRDQGLLPADAISGDSIRAWLAAHRGPEADAIMRLNPRYAFFRLAPDDGRPPVGAAGAPLPAGRAIAVDPTYHAYGEIFWIDGEAPVLAGAFPRYQRLVTALDTGGAIRGEVRADLYLGQGVDAGAEAGRVRHTLRLYRLVPR
ncbi:MAG TPA: MltA domain-containing protein [Phenylobacterium sp.]|nr:MltA domain-containing protein [Phenylobacterium sp.]